MCRGGSGQCAAAPSGSQISHRKPAFVCIKPYTRDATRLLISLQSCGVDRRATKPSHSKGLYTHAFGVGVAAC